MQDSGPSSWATPELLELTSLLLLQHGDILPASGPWHKLSSSASYMLCDNRQVLEPLYKKGSLSCHTADLVSLGGSSHRPWHHTLEAQEVLQTDPTVKGLQSVPWSLGDQFLRGKDYGVFP